MAKITLVVNTSWNVVNFRLKLLEALERQGHDISVIAPADEYSDRIPWPRYDMAFESSSLNPFTNLTTFIRLWALLRKIRPDLALLFTIKPNIYGNVAARLLGIRTVSNIAGLGAIFARDDWLAALVRGMYRLSLSRAGRVFFQNPDDRALFLERGLVPPNRVDLLPGSGVDGRHFDPSRFPPRKGGGKVVFLLAGRMLWDKGVSEYVAAARELLAAGHDAEFRLMGFLDADNPRAISSDDMRRLTEPDGLRYLGTSDNMAEALAEVDCVVLPSKYREGTPRILLEACAMEKVVITTDSPGCRDVVDDGITGYLCTPGDTAGLQDKLLEVINSGPELRQRMGREARRKILRSYDENIVIEKYLAAIESLSTG